MEGPGCLVEPEADELPALGQGARRDQEDALKTVRSSGGSSATRTRGLFIMVNIPPSFRLKNNEEGFFFDLFKAEWNFLSTSLSEK